MHMADALISPAVGGSMLAVTAGLIGYSSKKLKENLDEKVIPLMGVLGAFIFAGQMINFTIPATGSSGHIGGGMLLSILLGPYAAFITIASVLIIQAFFFADGGLLALGCNIVNMGLFPCFICYTLIYKKIVRGSVDRKKIFIGTTLAVVIGLQMGAFSVVLETIASGISALPFKTFVLLMQPIHLAIGLVEGIATSAIILFIYNAQPELAAGPAGINESVSVFPAKKVFIGLIAGTIIVGGMFSWFASTHPDGLEWSMFKTAGVEELEGPEHGVHSLLGIIQKKTAFLPDYSFRVSENAPKEEGEAVWPSVNAGTSVSGIVGGVLTLLLALLAGFLLKKRKKVAGNN
ncbi:MAG TPA: energy-coupling factor ABC transporter permease [Spirochaetota bacterium]|nr:energy-coupling factor ABC transporter permease [Spirochaetota bacterium]HPS87599.1 energy-coupling factor ABC transporter permease [Spirochaetota bacterium]